jgi:hypothetical protein
MVSPTWHHWDGNGVHSPDAGLRGSRTVNDPDATKPGHDEYERSEKTLRGHRNLAIICQLTKALRHGKMLLR